MSVWALVFGTVCEMIFHCALFGFSWADFAKAICLATGE